MDRNPAADSSCRSIILHGAQPIKPPACRRGKTRAPKTIPVDARRKHRLPQVPGPLVCADRASRPPRRVESSWVQRGSRPTSRSACFNSSPAPRRSPRPHGGGGRGSSEITFSVFDLDGRDSDVLFSSKLDLLVALNGQERVTWNETLRRRPPRDMHVVPRPEQSLRIWLEIGRSPESVLRAAELGPPMFPRNREWNAARLSARTRVDIVRPGRAPDGGQPADIAVPLHGFVGEADRDANATWHTSSACSKSDLLKLSADACSGWRRGRRRAEIILSVGPTVWLTRSFTCTSSSLAAENEPRTRTTLLVGQSKSR